MELVPIDIFPVLGLLGSRYSVLHYWKAAGAAPITLLFFGVFKMCLPGANLMENERYWPARATFVDAKLFGPGSHTRMLSPFPDGCEIVWTW
jgi:hypothetical protein